MSYALGRKTVYPEVDFEPPQSRHLGKFVAKLPLTPFSADELTIPMDRRTDLNDGSILSLAARGASPDS
jgi:hypothetical protein